jgi:hypothetical protein
MACTHPEDFIAKKTTELITSLTLSTLDTVKKQLEGMEICYTKLPEGTGKNAVAEAIRKSHVDLADAIIAKLKKQDQGTIDRLRSSSDTSAASDDSADSPKSQLPSLDSQMTQNLYFFTQSTLGRFIVAKVLQESTELKLPASLYMTDMVGAQPGDFFAASAALYPNGLFVAASKPPGRDLDQAAKIALLGKFYKPADTSGKLPIGQPGTWLPFVKTSTDALLGGTRPDTFHPQLQAEMKKDLPNQIKAKAADTSWITQLMSEKTGSPQWQTQFAGFEKELCDGLCLALEQTRANPDKALLQLTMSVANGLNTTETYKNVIAKLSDSKLAMLVEGDSEIRAMVAANPKWREAIGARVKDMAHEVQKSNLNAVLNVEVKLPKEAKEWVPKGQESHVGMHRDFQISPRMMLPHLQRHPIQLSEQVQFGKEVDLFCSDPTGKDAPNINELHHTALKLDGTKQPPEVKVRIDLIKGIVANLEIASKQNTTVADLGSRTWPTKIKPPLEAPAGDRLQSSSKSSYSRALKVFQEEKGSHSATPKTLRDWVQFLKHDGAAKSAKYKEQRDDKKVSATKGMYTALMNDSDEFTSKMEAIAGALDKKDIPEARKLLQEGLQGVGSTVTGLTDANPIKKRREVLTEMAQVYRRLDKAIVAMLEADKPAGSSVSEDAQPASSKEETKAASTVQSLKALNPISQEIQKELIPILRAYHEGRGATTPSEIAKHIATLQSECATSQSKVRTEVEKKEVLSGAVADLKKKDTELNELLDTIGQITARQQGNDDAVIALGAKPDATTGIGGSGLYGELSAATNELGNDTSISKTGLYLQLATATEKLGVAQRTLDDAIALLGSNTENAKTGLYLQLATATDELGVDPNPETEIIGRGLKGERATFIAERDRLPGEIQTKRDQITEIQGLYGNGGSKAKLTAEKNDLENTTIPRLTTQLANEKAALAKLTIDLENKYALLGHDTQLADLQKQIADVPGPTPAAGEEGAPLLGAAGPRTQEMVNAEIDAIQAQIDALQFNPARGGNVASETDIRAIPDFEILRAEINEKTILCDTLSITNSQTAERVRDVTLEIKDFTTKAIELTSEIAADEARIAELNGTDGAVGLIQEKETAVAAKEQEIHQFQAKIQALNADAATVGSILHATATRDEKQGEFTTTNDRKRLLEGTIIPRFQNQIAPHEATITKHQKLVARHDLLAKKYKPDTEAALPDNQVQNAIDANVLLLAAENIKLDIQTELLAAVTTKEGAITEREKNLTIYAKAQRIALECDTVLGEERKDFESGTLGDFLADLITEASAQSDSKHANLEKYQQLQTQLQKGLLGDAQNTIKTIGGTSLNFLTDVFEKYRKEHSAILKEVAPQAPSFISNLTPTWSTQTLALRATGTVKTLKDRIRLAVEYGKLRTTKASTPAATAAVKSYNDAINGTLNDTPPGKLPPLQTLLMNDTPEEREAAIKQLDDAIRDIRGAITRNKTATESEKDPKLPQVGNKLIAALNDLKSNIDQATRKTAAGRSDKMGEVERLRQALILLSDDHLSAGSVQTTTVLKQADFHKPTAKSTEDTQTTTVSLSAKAMLPTASAKLEKMGLLHNPATPWSAEVSTELCTLFLAEVQDNTALFATITDTTKDNFIAFRNSMAEANFKTNKSLQSLAKTVKEETPSDDSNVKKLDAIFKKLKATYQAIPGDKNLSLTNLKNHADSISVYLKSLEEDSATSAKITDPNEQKLLCTLGILVPTTSITIDDDAAKSIDRLYEHRLLTMGLLRDVQAAAPHAASAPNVIRCMHTAFSQATGLSGTKESDKDLMKTLCENSAAWSLALLQQPWDQDQSPKAAVTNADRLTNTISAYEQVCLLRDRLSVEVVEQGSTTQHATNLQNISDTLDHLLLDIQRGVDQCNTQGKVEVAVLSLHDTKAKQLAAVKKIKHVNPAQSASPSVSQQRLKFSEDTQPTLPFELTKKTRLSEFPPEFALTVGEQKQHVTRFYPDGEPHSKEAALATLFGKASSIPVDGNLLRSVHDDSDIATRLSDIATNTPITEAMQTRFVACLKQLPEATQKTILGLDSSAKLPEIDKTHGIVENINRYLNFVKEADTAAIYPQDLLFLSELYARPICLFTHHSLGTEKLTMERTFADSKEKPIHIAVSEGNYERWEIRSETSAAAPQMYSAYSSTYAASTQAKRLPRSVLPPNAQPLVRKGDQFGAAFSGNTGITCWLEAFIYSTAYERDGDGATLKLLKANSEKLNSSQKDSKLEKWKIANPARADALIMLSAFLESVKSSPETTLNITDLDRTLQRVFFGEAWRQQDAMQFREMLMGTLCEIMKAEQGNDVPTPFSMTRASKNVIGGTEVQTTENRFMAHEAVEFRINLHQEGVECTKTPDLSAYLVSQDADNEKDYQNEDKTWCKIKPGKREFVGTAPPTCQIQVMSAVNDYTHASPVAHTLTPTAADTDDPFITLPIKASADADADAAAVETGYLIKQVVVRRGAGTEGGHYECYFEHNDQWYLKTSNGNPATKVGGGFPAIHRNLIAGGHTYTYMGVKVP